MGRFLLPLACGFALVVSSMGDEDVPGILSEAEMEKMRAAGMPPMNPEDEEHYHSNMMGVEPSMGESGEGMDKEKYQKKVMEALDAQFGSWDTDQDGSLSKEELKARLKAVRDVNVKLEWDHSSLEANELHGQHGRDLSLDDLLEMWNHYRKMSALSSQEGEEADSDLESDDGEIDYNHIAFRFWTFDSLPDESFVKKYFEMGDLNKDGSLSKDELPYLMNPYLDKTRDKWMKLEAAGDFQREDKNKDGFVTEEELVAMYKEHGVQEAEAMAKDMLNGLDHNQDGKLSIEEKTVHHHPNGEIEEPALPRGSLEPPPPELELRGDEGLDGTGEMPVDHDWEEEQLEQEVEMLFEHDADKNGALSLEELKGKIFEQGWEGSLLPHNEL